MFGITKQQNSEQQTLKQQNQVLKHQDITPRH